MGLNHPHLNPHPFIQKVADIGSIVTEVANARADIVRPPLQVAEILSKLEPIGVRSSVIGVLRRALADPTQRTFNLYMNPDGIIDTVLCSNVPEWHPEYVHTRFLHRIDLAGSYSLEFEEEAGELAGQTYDGCFVGKVHVLGAGPRKYGREDIVEGQIKDDLVFPHPHQVTHALNRRFFGEQEPLVCTASPIPWLDGELPLLNFGMYLPIFGRSFGDRSVHTLYAQKKIQGRCLWRVEEAFEHLLTTVRIQKTYEKAGFIPLTFIEV